MPGQSLAGVFNQRLAGRDPKLPEDIVGNAANVLRQGFRRAPSQRSLPHACVQRSSAGAESQVGMWTPLVTLSDGHFIRRPLGKKRLEEMPADLAVQTAHAVDRPAAADGQIGHVETFRRIARIPASQGQQVVEG